MSISVWRIAQDTRDYEADDLSGRGAKITGGRWNYKGTPLVYASSNRTLAGFETIVHFNAGGLPFNRYLVEIVIPEDVWAGAQILIASTAPIGWDAEPASKTSADYGDNWIKSNVSLLLVVPSVIVPEESNILINPRHPDISKSLIQKFIKHSSILRAAV